MSSRELHQSKYIRHVLLSGGTHGNEYTGAFLVRHWLSQPQSVRRAGFSTHLIFSNPAAFGACRRYLERDLNRCFRPSEIPSHPDALEIRRANEIEDWLLENCDRQLPDAIFDLHSTTANMGMSLVLTNTDPFNLLLYAYLRSLFSDVNAFLWEEKGSRPGFLNSMSRNGFAIEVGPVANGVLNAEWVLKTSALVNACLDFVGLWNEKSEKLNTLSKQVPVYSFCRHIDYPRASDGYPSAMIHPALQNRDFQLLKEGDPIFLGFDGSVVSWTEESVFPVFVNEAAYYEKGIAFTVAQKLDMRIEI